MALNIPDYEELIDLHQEYVFKKKLSLSKEEIVDSLLKEFDLYRKEEIPYNKKRALLRAKLNTLQAKSMNKKLKEMLDHLLQTELTEKPIEDSKRLKTDGEKQIGKTKLSVWQGDITYLKIDAIVNAANSAMLGCFQPLHNCIDNAIHSAAGVQLRDDCHKIMQKQGYEEPTGMAKITRAYNLPSKYIIHTVGPIVRGELSQEHKNLLRKSYVSILNLCKEMNNIKSVALCGISTGVFGFPVEDAAKIAMETCEEWLLNNPNVVEYVVFNVFTDEDKNIYSKLISE